MNEIPDLKNDYDFLKKFNARNNQWKEIDTEKSNERRRRTRTNFLLHPKRLSSESECSSVVNSPSKFFSNTVIKNASLNEINNNLNQNVKKRIAHTEACRIISDEDGDFCVETNVDDGFKSFETLHKTKMIIESSNISVAHTKRVQKCHPCSSARFENFDKKLATVVERTSKVLGGIREMMEKGISPPDGEEDYMRRMKRLQEFSARFSRNYLYPLVRQMDELSVPDKMSPVQINQKIMYAHQVIYQGLQAYYNHLPSSVGRCCSEKLKQLLDQAVYLCQVHEILKKDPSPENNEFVNIMRTQTEQLLETINIFDLRILEKIRKSDISTKSKKKVRPQNNKKKSKLSMYAVSASYHKDTEWKKAVETLAKKKFNVKSKYKTACFKHRPPVEKPHLVSLPSKLFPKRSSVCLKTTPATTPVREDDIKTMVEMESELQAPPNSGKILNHENSIASNEQQLVRDSDRDSKDEVEDGSVKKALEVLRKFLGDSAQDQAHILDKIATEVDKKKQETEKEEKPKKKLKEPTVTVTGAKNAKLICIRDDNSVAEEDETKQNKEIMTDAEIQLVSSETQTDLRPEDKSRARSRSAIKISRLPKANKKMLTLLPKDYAINIIQYKLRYAQFHKQNPMYRKCTNMQPWVLMGRVSDKILDDLLQSVTNELEVNEILENLYNAEFQY